jgi:acetyl-CoA C-acetyltransferase
MPQVSVDGVAVRASRFDPRLSLSELIFCVVSEALADARCTMADVDGIVIAGHDLIDGRSLSSMITGPAAGAYLRDEIRFSDDGLVAVSLATARLQAREASKVVVASWGRASEGDVERSSRVAFDPFAEQPLGISAAVVSALRASTYLRTHSPGRRDAAAAARQRRAATNPRRAASEAGADLVYPLRPAEMGTRADVAAAVVLGTGGGPTITGTGHGTEAARLGDRNLGVLEGARAATAAAYRQSGRAPHDVDVAELGGLTLFDEVLLLEAAGLAEMGAGLDVYAANAWVNPSGGSASGSCYPCEGLLRFVDAVHQLRGQAGPAQIPGSPAVALVAAGSAVASQTTTAVIIEAA